MPTSPVHDRERTEGVRAHQFREACDSVAIASDRRTFTLHFEKQVLVMGTRNRLRVGEVICGGVCMRACCGGGTSRHNLVEIRS